MVPPLVTIGPFFNLSNRCTFYPDRRVVISNQNVFASEIEGVEARRHRGEGDGPFNFDTIAPRLVTATSTD